MRETVKYTENQYLKGQLVLIAHCTYNLNFDSVSSRYFVSNQYNELIYLDQIESFAVVQISPNKTIITSFFYSEKKNQIFSDIKKSYDYFFFDILYIILILILIVILSVSFHFFLDYLN